MLSQPHKGTNGHWVKGVKFFPIASRCGIRTWNLHLKPLGSKPKLVLFLIDRNKEPLVVNCMSWHNSRGPRQGCFVLFTRAIRDCKMGFFFLQSFLGLSIPSKLIGMVTTKCAGCQLGVMVSKFTSTLKTWNCFFFMTTCFK